MSHTMKKSWRLAGAAMFLAACPLFAAPQTVTFNLTSIGSGANLGGVYTSPYAGNINGVGGTIPVICDDFADDSYVPETWTAYVNSLSSILSGSGTDLRWGAGWNGTGNAATPTLSLSQADAYATAAILAIDILTNTGLTQEEYSYAMWELFDPTQASAALPSTYQSTVAGFIKTAASEATGGNLSAYLDGATVTFYSYDQAAGAPSCNGGPCPSAPPQEFVTVSMAEPPSPAMLGFDLLAVGGLIFISRRRSSRSLA